MNDLTTSSDLNQDLNELKEKLVKREDVWIIPDRYYLELDLNPTQALLLTIIRQTGKKKGYSEISYSYIRQYTKQQHVRTIAKDLQLLEEKKLVYIHRYVSKSGKRRKYVTQENAGKYWSYLSHINQYGERKKLEEEFMLHINISREPEPKSSKEKEDPNPASGENPVGKSASAKNAHGPSAKNAHAINTTYLLNKRNDVTCKEPPIPANSDEVSAAASFSKLKEDLENSFSNTEVAIGMKWYEMQSDAKKATMKKPIACIVQALKGGYAHKEVSAQNAQLAAQRSQETQEKFIRDKAKKEMNSNEKLSHQLILKFSGRKGWRHSIDSKGFTIFCDAAKKCKDPESNSTFYSMPNGEEWAGTLGLRVPFDLPPQEFKHILKKYFVMSEWSHHTQMEQMEA